MYFQFDDAILRQLSNRTFKEDQSPGGYRPETGCGLYPLQCSHYFATIQGHFGAEAQFDVPVFGEQPP